MISSNENKHQIMQNWNWMFHEQRNDASKMLKPLIKNSSTKDVKVFDDSFLKLASLMFGSEFMCRILGAAGSALGPAPASGRAARRASTAPTPPCPGQAPAGLTLNSGIGIVIVLKPVSRDWILGLGLGSGKAYKEKISQPKITEIYQTLPKVAQITKNYSKW